MMVSRSFTLTIYVQKNYSHSCPLTNTLQTCNLQPLRHFGKHFASMQSTTIEAFFQTLGNNEFEILLQPIQLRKFRN